MDLEDDSPPGPYSQYEYDDMEDVFNPAIDLPEINTDAEPESAPPPQEGATAEDTAESPEQQT